MLPVDTFSQLYLKLSIFLSYLIFIIVNLVEMLVLKSFVQEFFLLEISMVKSSQAPRLLFNSSLNSLYLNALEL